MFGSDAHVLDLALVRACRAAKDRTADHLASIISREPADPADRAVLRTASENAMLAIIASSQLPWTRRLRATILSSGRGEDDARPDTPGTGTVLEVFDELGVSPLLLAACRAYAARQRDFLPVLVPFAAMLRATKTSNGHVVTHDLPEPELIGVGLTMPSTRSTPTWAAAPLISGCAPTGLSRPGFRSRSQRLFGTRRAPSVTGR